MSTSLTYALLAGPALTYAVLAGPAYNISLLSTLQCRAASATAMRGAETPRPGSHVGGVTRQHNTLRRALRGVGCWPTLSHLRGTRGRRDVEW